MTEQTQPTDAELEACPFCGNANAIVYDDLLTFHAGCLSCGSTGSVSSYRNGAIAAWNRRAVLAKWSTPAGAGEVAGWINAGELLALKQGAAYAHVYSSKQTGASQPVFTTPQPTQAQAGAVPLKYARLHAISLEYSDSEDECTGFRDGWRAAEKHHGIKGADHA